MAEKPDKARLLRRLGALAIPAVFFSYLISASFNYPLNDPDLWWHLKTGEYIIESGELPAADPFAYTTPPVLNENQKIGIRAQWLGQVIYHLSFKAGKIPGVIAMRGLLIVLPMLILYAWLARRKEGPLVSLSVVGFPALIFALMLFYSFERPQGMSFSLVLLLVILLERVRRRSSTGGFDFSYVALPALTALWSNIHAGFIVGNVIIVAYVGAEAATYLYRKVKGRGSTGTGTVFFAVCAVAVAASFLNPASYKLFLLYFKGMLKMVWTDIAGSLSQRGGGSWVRAVVLEYKPLSFFYRELGYDWLIFYWAFTAVLYLTMLAKYWVRRKFDAAEFLTVTIVVVFANTYARGLMFSLSVMPFYFAKSVVEMRGTGSGFKVLRLAAPASALLLSVALLVSTYLSSPQTLKPSAKTAGISPWYPVQAVEFIYRNPLRPPMYNYYTWGGFLLWSLYPSYQVFIDGRAIDNGVSAMADGILKAQPGWRQSLNAFDINFIVIPPVFRESGHVVPLAVALVGEEKWKLVFLKYNAAIFVRDVPVNSAIIDRFNIDKHRIYKEIITVENVLLRHRPYSPVHNLAKADALFALGLYEEAKAIYARFPSRAAPQLDRLRRMGY